MLKLKPVLQIRIGKQFFQFNRLLNRFPTLLFQPSPVAASLSFSRLCFDLRDRLAEAHPILDPHTGWREDRAFPIPWLNIPGGSVMQCQSGTTL